MKERGYVIEMKKRSTSKMPCTVKYFICVLILLWTTNNVYGASAKEDYELQEKCGKRCEEMFKKEYGRQGFAKDGTLNSYQNHYNKKLNKCFILVSTTVPPQDKQTDFLYMKFLSDINENKEYGSFLKSHKDPRPLTCYVLEKTCVSEMGWNLLIKPYMEE